ncbi:MAG: hypothetical protein WBI71_00700 [Methanothermobacter tenebrarum]
MIPKNTPNIIPTSMLEAPRVNIIVRIYLHRLLLPSLALNKNLGPS